MPKLPYISQANIDTGLSNELLSIDEFQRTQRAQQGLGSAMTDIANQWEEAEAFSQKLSAKNKFTEDLYGLLTEVEEFNSTDSRQLKNKQDDINARLSEIGVSAGNTITNKKASLEFNLMSQESIIKIRHQISGQFRKKTIDNAKAGLMVSLRNNYNSYLKTGNEGFKKAYEQDLQGGFDNGYWDSIFLEKEKEDLSGWGFKKAINDARSNPEYFIENFDNMTKGFDEDKKYKLMKEAKEVSEFNSKKQDMINTINMNIAEEKTSQEIINAETSQALSTLQDRFDNNEISEKYFNTARKMVISKKGINNRTTSEFLQNAVLDIENLETKDLEAKTILNNTASINERLMNGYAEGVISKSDLIEQQKKLYSLNSVKKARGEVMAEEKRFFGFGFGYSDATKILNDKLADKVNVPTVFDKYFRYVEGKDFDKKEKKEVLEDLIRQSNYETIKGFSRNFKNEEDAINSGLPEGSIVYINGKRFRLEK